MLVFYQSPCFVIREEIQTRGYDGSNNLMSSASKILFRISSVIKIRFSFFGFALLRLCVSPSSSVFHLCSSVAKKAGEINLDFDRFKTCN
jgi:hypothetical protein